MSLFDTIGIHPIESALKCTDQYLKKIHTETFAEASFGNKVVRTSVSVGSMAISLKLFKVGLPLIGKAIAGAPIPLLFSAIAVIGVPFTYGLSLTLFIPVAAFSLPILIQLIGASITIALGVGCLALAAKSLHFI